MREVRKMTENDADMASVYLQDKFSNWENQVNELEEYEYLIHLMTGNRDH